ncbi:hypothetical protein PF006_g24982 [Phytophthora fragariae]|uniref:Uncharacterized protein n=1 Tax=Phytophthora fragariae TaxID=53985 RepID=A0A6A3R6R2_9STRA|nr:hypothetical protein PF006_g24982 [Phytophthora fragariae]
MQKDRSQGLMRSNIFVKGTRVQTPAKSVGVAHVKARQRLAVKASKQEAGSSGSPTLTPEQAQRDGDVYMTTPPVSPVPSSS